MIIKALADYYELLLHERPNEIARPGWSSQRVISLLEIDSTGALVNVIPAEDKKGWNKTVPAQAKRSSGVKANFLCDNVSYLLGVDSKGKPERSLSCFEAARSMHRAILSDVDSPCARALLAFFETWDPLAADDNPAFARERDTLLAGGSLAFIVRDLGEPLCDQAIQAAWDHHLEQSAETETATCLVSGKRAPIARLHPSIKGIYGGQPTGVSLVAFNQPAFESYGCDGKQGLNAPVSENVTRAYTTALNYLLTQRQHTLRLGDTTVVFWSQSSRDEANAQLAAFFLGALPHEGPNGTGIDENQQLNDVISRIAAGKPCDEADFDFDAPFFIVGLAPNVAMVTVRFFLSDTFGSVIGNLARHYERLSIVHAPNAPDYVSPYWILCEVENPNSSKPVISSELGGALMRSILQDAPYPEALFQNALLRIRATHEVTRGRAAIIKAYLLKNRGYSKEDITVSLNEERNETAYALGRAFSVLEQIQECANGASNIAGRYLDSACSTPAMVFPTLLKLSTAHLEKIARQNPGLATHFRKQLGEILQQGRVDVFPKRLSLTEQGDYLLGYYHQTQKRYERKSINDDKTALDDTQEA